MIEFLMLSIAKIVCKDFTIFFSINQIMYQEGYSNSESTHAEITSSWERIIL